MQPIDVQLRNASSNASETNILVRRIDRIARLNDEEREALRLLPMTRRYIAARQDIIRDGDRPSQCCAILSGFVIRYKLGADGRRQILSFHIPGDIPDLQGLHLEVLDHTIGTLTPVVAGFISHDAMREIHRQFPRLTEAFWRESLIDAAIFREAVVNLGHRDALARTAHFLCEIYVRLEAVGLASGHELELPITQGDMADALGMSSVHANRVIQDLRSRGLVTIEKGNVAIHDWGDLSALGEFDPGYLHLHRADLKC